MNRRIGPIGGVYVQLGPFWAAAYGLLALGIFLVGVPGSTVLSPAYAVVLGLVAAPIVLISYAAHELTHGIVARRLGVPIQDVTLFGLIDPSKPAVDPPSGRVEAITALSGVVVSFLATALFGLAWWAAYGAAHDEFGLMLVDVLWWAAAGNAAIAIVNSVPGYPYDGGRVVRGLLWARSGDKLRATAIAARIGRFFAIALMAAGAIWALLTGELLLPLWVIGAGFFLLQGSRRQYRRLEVRTAVEGLTVGEVMDENMPVVGPNLTLDTLFGQHERDDTIATYPVTADGVLLGSIEVSQIERVPRAQWARTRVGDVMTRLERLHTLTGGQSVMDAMARFDRSTVDALAVVDEDKRDLLVGLVTRDRLIEKLRPHVRRMADRERALGSSR